MNSQLINCCWKLSQLGKIWSSCTKSSSILRPTKGNAILFFTLHPNATPDKSSSHARCPVLEGEMWYATKLFHIRSISGEKISLEVDGTECTDEDENCPRWAAIGECQRNPVFMIGSPDYYGTCRKSCNACWWATSTPPLPPPPPPQFGANVTFFCTWYIVSYWACVA